MSMDLAALRLELMAAASAQTRLPEGRFEGRGIVICAGGARIFTCAWVLVALLRRTLGCTLPIEVWHLGPEELGPPMRGLLEELDARPVDALEVAKRHELQRLGGWELKSYAVLNSRFREVLLLDADNVPIKDPSYLFESAAYQETGSLFWPDIVRISRANPVWTVSQLPYRDAPAFESGQMMLDKSRCWRALSLAHWMNQRSNDFYELLYGDKDTFLLAWLLLGQPHHLICHQPKLLEHTLCQRDPSGAVLFQHRNGAKWILYGNNPRIEGFRLEQECFQLLQQLATLWDGRVFNPPPRSSEARAIERKLAETRQFRFVLVSSDERRLELLAGHRIGSGASSSELYWYVVDGEQGPELAFERDGYRSCLLSMSPDGIWHGVFLHEPGMPVELVPLPRTQDSPIHTIEPASHQLMLLLDRVLDQYVSLPFDREVARDLVGTIRTLAVLDAAVLVRLQAEATQAQLPGTHAEVIRAALDALAEPAHRPDCGVIAAGHNGLDQQFLWRGYDPIE